LSYKGVACLREGQVKLPSLPHGRQVKLPSLAGTTRTCGLRLRRAALCPAELRRDGLASRATVKLRSVDARGRTWNTRLRRPVLCPLSYVDRDAARKRGGSNARSPLGLPGFKPGSSTIRIASRAGRVRRVRRREWDSNPRTGAARLPPFQSGPLSSLGISPRRPPGRGWRRAGESNSQTGVRRPSAFEAGGLTTCPGPP
jgi:hypothetical protein